MRASSPSGERALDARTNAAKDTARILDEVRQGLRSVRNASLQLGWVDEDVQMAAFGEILQ